MQKQSKQLDADDTLIWWQRNWSPELDQAIRAINEALLIQNTNIVEASKFVDNALELIKQNIETISSSGQTQFSAKSLDWINKIRQVSTSQDEETRSKLILLLELFDYPQYKLAAYGSLMPGKSNHHLVAPIEGQWLDATIRGDVHQHEGYPRYRWDPDGDKIKASILHSQDLPNHYERLDLFEGTAYIRILVPATIEDTVVIANVYATSQIAN